MPKKSMFENESSDSFDVVVNALKENSETLELLMKEMRTISDRLEEVCELSAYKRIEGKIDGLQNEVRSLNETNSDSAVTQQVGVPAKTFAEVPAKDPEQNLPPPPELTNPRTILRCKNWDEFVAYASGAQVVSFGYREADRVFEVDALKNGQVAVYVGDWPKFELLLKAWLSGQLMIPEKKIFEGALTTH